MTAQQQQALDSFYALDNVITVKITMPQTEWDKVRLEEPKSGRCEWDWTGGSRYTWRQADTVEISGTRFPARTTFNNVGVKKKSFCGSIDDKKPCLHLDFGRFSNTNEDAIEALIGSRYVTLNNSKQDKSYIRQTLGYRMLGMAGLPHSRCNYARVFVNGTPIGQGLGGELFPGIFVNAEPIMKRYIERNFNGNMNGNLYEIEHTDDFLEERLRFIGVEDLSEFDDKADLKFACRHIKANGLAGADQLLDMEQYLKVYAMEFLLKHWDGYANNTNNTYLYNDVTAVASPGVGDIKFKMIPWGIDQILKPREFFRLGRDGVIAQLVRNDDTRRKQLIDQIRVYRETLFSREKQQTVLKPLDRPNAGSANRIRRARSCGGDRFSAAAVAAGRVGRIYLHRPAWRRQPGLHPQARHQSLSACQQYRVDSTGHTHSGELRGLPPTAVRQQSSVGSLGSERPRDRKVADQPGVQPRSARQRYASHRSGTQVPLHLCAE